MSIRICEVCEGDIPATMAFRWDWGETGYCSDKGRALLEQKAQALQRSVTFERLADIPARPLELDERAQLAGRIYALEHEVGAQRARGTELYQELQRMRADNRVLVLANEEAKRLVEELKARNLELEGALSEARRSLVGAQEEAAVLREVLGREAPTLPESGALPPVES